MNPNNLFPTQTPNPSQTPPNAPTGNGPAPVPTQPNTQPASFNPYAAYNANMANTNQNQPPAVQPNPAAYQPGVYNAYSPADVRPDTDKFSGRNDPLPDPSVDPGQYLKRISRDVPLQKTFFDKIRYVIIGGGALIVVLIIVGVVSIFNTSRAPESLINGVALGNDFTALSAIVAYGGEHALQPEVAKVVAEANLTLLSQQKALASTVKLTSTGSTSTEGVPPPPDTDKIISQFDDAKVLGKLDSVFAAELNSRMTSILNRIQALKTPTDPSLAPGANAQAILNSAYQDFTALLGRMPQDSAGAQDAKSGDTKPQDNAPQK